MNVKEVIFDDNVNKKKILATTLQQNDGKNDKSLVSHCELTHRNPTTITQGTFRSLKFICTCILPIHRTHSANVQN